MSKKLADYTPEDLTRTSYDEILRLRREAYAERIAAMSLDPALSAWAERMAARHGSETVRVWHNVLPWLEALAVVRYGEAPEHWPAEVFSEKDVARAAQWEAGDVPAGVRQG